MAALLQRATRAFPMLRSTLVRLTFAALAACCATLPATASASTKQTVCTITVNSSDEKQAFRRQLPASQFEFVELVERGRPDWLESARRKHVRCDILVISGHYDGGDYAGGNEFFSEHVDSREYLPVDEMERVACTDRDDGLFSHLKAVYLFGCNTLNPVPLRSAADEIAQSLVESGHSRTEAERVAREMSPRFADSSRDRMRHIFRHVPAIYGFSSVAPLGPTAATYLDRYFRAGGASEVAAGPTSSRILGYFPGRSLTLARGSTDADADVGFQRDVCHFLDEHDAPLERARFVHSLLRRDMAEVRIFLDRLERYAAVVARQPRTPALDSALAEIANDADVRTRYLAFTHATRDAGLRVRLIDLAERFGWLSRDDKLAELARFLADRFAQPQVTAADVEWACKLNADHSLDAAGRAMPVPRPPDVVRDAMLACLGRNDRREAVLQALTSASDTDVQVARVYLRYRPLDDADELREIAGGIAQMRDASAQVRAIDALADHRVSDPQVLDDLARLFPMTKSLEVQRAIAGALIRADYQAMATPALVRTLRVHRLKSHEGRDLIDVLIDRLDAAS
jgi:hypothetical protein